MKVDLDIAFAVEVGRGLLIRETWFADIAKREGKFKSCGFLQKSFRLAEKWSQFRPNHGGILPSLPPKPRKNLPDER